MKIPGARNSKVSDVSIVTDALHVQLPIDTNLNNDLDAHPQGTVPDHSFRSSLGSVTTGDRSTTPTSARSFSSHGSQFEYLQKHKHCGVAWRIFCALLLVLRVAWSISAIMVIITITAAVVPALLVWQESSRGLLSVQEDLTREALARRASDIAVTLSIKLDSCEKLMNRYGTMIDGLPDNGSDMEQLVYASNYAYLNFYDGECSRSLSSRGRDGFINMGLLNSRFGDFYFTQYGYPPDNCVQTVHPGSRETVTILFNETINVPTGSPGTFLDWYEERNLLDMLHNSYVFWSDIEPITSGTTGKKVAMSLHYGWHDTSDETQIRGVHRLASSSLIIDALFTDAADEGGVVCAFITDARGYIVGSTCDNSTIVSEEGVVSLRPANNSAFEYVCDAHKNMPKSHDAVDNDNIAVIMDHTVDGVQYAYAYTWITTTAGFNVTVVVVGRQGYFDDEYVSALNRITAVLCACTCGTGLIAVTIVALVCLGLHAVVSRLNKMQKRQVAISSINKKHNNNNNSGISRYCSKGVLSKFIPWMSLLEVHLMMRRVVWLGGITDMVAKFVPSVSKLLFEQHRDPHAVARCGMNRLPGTYMFLDVVGFTRLCENQFMDDTTVARILERVYEIAAQEVVSVNGGKLIKYLGDGAFFMWGALIKGSVPGSVSRSGPYQALASAKSIAERVGELDIAIHKTSVELCAIPDDWHLSVRVGISTGIALQGIVHTSIGSSVDVIGSKVNLAARLEQYGKSTELLDAFEQQHNNANECEALSSSTDYRTVCTIVMDDDTYSIVGDNFTEAVHVTTTKLNGFGLTGTHSCLIKHRIVAVE